MLSKFPRTDPLTPRDTIILQWRRRLSVRGALERMGLSEFFIATVAAEDGMETIAQRFLSAAIKLGRPPDHCVTFVPGSLAGITAAHNCTMKARAFASL